MKKIILASTSPSRKRLLQQLGLQFVVVPSNFEEKLNPRLKPRGQAELLSKGKAHAVAENHTEEDTIIIAADSVIDYKGETLGKPKSREDAKRTLTRLSGETHTAITAFTIFHPKSRRIITKSVETKVYFRKLSAKEIDAYVATDEPMTGAGSYSIEKKGAILVSGIEGDYSSVVGLPLAALTEELKRFGVSVM